MGHEHHTIVSSKLNNAFIIGIILNSLFIIFELAIGFHINSMSLVSDAVHNITDVGALCLSLLGWKLTTIHHNDKFTYGYKKISILIALFNSIVLIISICGIGIESIRKLFYPTPLSGPTIAWVATVGIIVNGISALLLFKEKDKDLNVKSSYLHLLSDTYVSATIAIGGLIIFLTDIYWIDSIMSLSVALIILYSTWSLFKDSLKATIDGVPDGISIVEIRNMALKISGITELHHIHIWALSSNMNAMTAHLILDNKITKQEEIIIKQNFRDLLAEKNIVHVTLECEKGYEDCKYRHC